MPATQWRINITANNDGTNYTAFSEISMRIVPSGSNVISGGTASAISSFTDCNPSYAIDGSNSTRWVNNGEALPHWWQYTFSAPIEIVEITLRTENGIPGRAPKDFTLKYYDGTTWVTAIDVTSSTAWSEGETRTFTRALYSLTGDITESLAITDWRLTAIRCSDGSSIGTAVTSGASYTISNMVSNALCCIHIEPKIDYAWSASKIVALNDYCVPVNPDTTPRLYKATAIGSSPHQTHATTEPTWPTSGTVADNDITWTFLVDLDDGMWKTLGAKIPS